MPASSIYITLYQLQSKLALTSKPQSFCLTWQEGYQITMEPLEIVPIPEAVNIVAERK